MVTALKIKRDFEILHDCSRSGDYSVRALRKITTSSELDVEITFRYRINPAK
jgi:hypothetical protein